jgi:hypothetical protein
MRAKLLCLTPLFFSQKAKKIEILTQDFILVFSAKMQRILDNSVKFIAKKRLE